MRRPTCLLLLSISLPACTVDLGAARLGGASVKSGETCGEPADWLTGSFTSLTGGQAFAGDVNGDGRDDALGFDYSEPDNYLYLTFGTASGVAYSPDQVLDLAPLAPGLYSVAWAGGVGDVDADGYADVAVTLAYDDSSGGAMLFRGGPAGLEATPAWTIRDLDANGNGGFVGAAGDLDSDGYDDVVLTLHATDATPRVLVFQGSASGLGAAPDVELDLPAESFFYGYTQMGSAGDLDGDGYGDLLVTSSYPGGFRGILEIRYGGPAGVSAAPDVVLNGSAPYSGLGWGYAVAAAGDFNDDGVDDLAYSERFLDRVHVHYGGSGGIGATPDLSYSSATPDGNFGHALAACDLDSDGDDDLLLARTNDEGTGAIIEAHLGGAGGPAADPVGGLSSSDAFLSLTCSWTVGETGTVGLLGGLAGDGAYLGLTPPVCEEEEVDCAGGYDTWAEEAWVVGLDGAVLAGDVDGDGYEDAVGWDGSGGSLDLRSGGDGLDGEGTSQVSVSDVYGDGSVGAIWLWDVAGVGDVNGDGYDDVGAAASQGGNNSSEDGGVFVFFGGPDGFAATPPWTSWSTDTYSNARRVTGLGDVDGDGFDDFVYTTHWSTSSPRVIVVRGSATGPDESTAVTLTVPTENLAETTFGDALLGGGDFNGDGLGDLYVGGAFATSANLTCIEVRLGTPAGIPAAADARVCTSSVDPLLDDHGGHIVVADLDHDGYDDLTWGSTYTDVSIYRGGPTGLAASPDAVLTNPLSGLSADAWSLGACDADQDGYEDLLVAGAYTSVGYGIAVYRGSATGFTTPEPEPVGLPTSGGASASMRLGCTTATVGGGAVLLVQATFGAVGHGLLLGAETCVEPVDPDADGDGSPASADCDDADPRIFPGAREECDGVDTNCDGFLDPADCVVDSDGDGWLETVDCDDHDASRYPGAPELCDFTDNDCDGRVDEAVTQLLFEDADGDGAGSSIRRVSACEGVAGYSSRAGDCADEDPLVGPGFPELCDGLDNDCDGTTDELGRGASCASGSQGTGADADGDGWLGRADCDDSNPDAHPGAGEACDGVDTDCDGFLDDGTNAIVFADADGDGYGDRFAMTMACALAPGFTTQAGDCDDDDAGVHPGAPDTCDVVDNDCDGEIDERAAETCSE